MANISKEELEKRIDELPEEIQNLLYSPEMYTAVKQVSSKHQLHVDQMDLLETETAQVMLGFTETAQFPQAIAQSLKLDTTQATAIAKDINDTLFVKIREAMKPKVVEATQKISNPPAATTPAVSEKSVVMPSAIKAPEPVAAVPATPAAAPAVESVAPSAPMPAMQTIPSMPAIVKPVGLPMMPHVDAMLHEPTVSIAPKPAATTAPVAPATPTAPAPVDIKKSDTPATPPIYKTDPYHEPID